MVGFHGATAKQCRKCGRVVQKNEWPRGLNGRLRHICCGSGVNTREVREQYMRQGRKVCSVCAAEKPAGDYYSRKNTGTLLPACVPCHNQMKDARRGYTQTVRQERERERNERLSVARATSAARKAWRWWLTEGAADSWVRAYYADEPWRNPRLSEAEQWRLRYAHDSEFAVRERMRLHVRKHRGRLVSERIRQALKRNGRSPSAEEIIGYSTSALRDHLERQFTRGMSWEKFAQGKIHIDHIVPVNDFNLDDDDDIRRCWALANLRPMWANENIRKHAARTHLL